MGKEKDYAYENEASQVFLLWKNLCYSRTEEVVRFGVFQMSLCFPTPQVQIKLFSLETCK